MIKPKERKKKACTCDLKEMKKIEIKYKDFLQSAYSIGVQDGIKLEEFSEKSNQYIYMMEAIERMKPNERKVSTFGEWQAETYEEKMLVRAVLDKIIDYLNQTPNKKR